MSRLAWLACASLWALFIGAVLFAPDLFADGYVFAGVVVAGIPRQQGKNLGDGDASHDDKRP